jgi:hypothetical protein
MSAKDDAWVIFKLTQRLLETEGKLERLEKRLNPFQWQRCSTCQEMHMIHDLVEYQHELLCNAKQCREMYEQGLDAMAAVIGEGVR